MRYLIATVIILLEASFVTVQAEDMTKKISLPSIPVELRAGDGKAKVEALCAICHSLDYITTQPPLTKAQWTAAVNKMIKVMGAPIKEDDAKVITEYLVKEYGSGN